MLCDARFLHDRSRSSQVRQTVDIKPSMTVIGALEPTDAPAIFAAVDCSRVALRRWMSWYHDAYGLVDAESWLQDAIAARATGNSQHFAICDADGRLVGVLGFENIGAPPGRAMIGYWIATPATRRGLGTRAVRDAVAWARTHLGHTVVWAVVAAPNVASRHVLEANGFRAVRPGDANVQGDAQVIYELALHAEAIATHA